MIQELVCEDTYKHLYTTWYEQLCKYAYSILKDTSESEDMVQKVFFTLWDNRFETNINTSIKAYLYKAVHNNCLNRIKQLKVQDEYKKQIILGEEDVRDEVYETVIEKELDYKIKLALAGLPPKCREVFELSRFEMYTYKEIAYALNISPNTVENQIAKALKLLRISLKDFIPVILFYYLIKLYDLW